MSRPYLPKTLAALKEYVEVEDGRFKWRLSEIAARHGIHTSSLSRAAKKHGLYRHGKS